MRTIVNVVSMLSNYHKDYDAKNRNVSKQTKARLGIEWSGRIQISMSRLQQSHETKTEAITYEADYSQFY